MFIPYPEPHKFKISLPTMRHYGCKNFGKIICVREPKYFHVLKQAANIEFSGLAPFFLCFGYRIPGSGVINTSYVY